MRDRENNREDQWNQKSVLWKDQKNWYTPSQTHQGKKKKNERERAQTNELSKDKGEITTDSIEI